MPTAWRSRDWCHGSPSLLSLPPSPCSFFCYPTTATSPHACQSTGGGQGASSRGSLTHTHLPGPLLQTPPPLYIFSSPAATTSHPMLSGAGREVTSSRCLLSLPSLPRPRQEKPHHPDLLQPPLHLLLLLPPRCMGACYPIRFVSRCLEGRLSQLSMPYGAGQNQKLSALPVPSCSMHGRACRASRDRVDGIAGSFTAW